MNIKLLYKIFTIIKRDGFRSFINRVVFKLQHRLPRFNLKNSINSSGEHKMKILYIVGCLEGESKRYRVFNLIEALKAKEIYSEFKYEINSELKNDNFMLQFDMIVLFRAAYSSNIERIIMKAEELNIPTVFDVDDLVFDENVVDSIDGIKNFSEAEKNEYIDGVRRYYKTFQKCNYGTASTSYLAECMNKQEKCAYVIPNSLNGVQIENAGKIKIKDKNEKIIIGYLSGSNTHGRDFEECVSAIKKIMDEHESVVLRIIGHLDIEKYMNGYMERVEKREFVDWKVLGKEISELDINLAPLELKNEFCNAKSELKYFEAAVVGVPTVASATHTFSECIINMKNGMLCSNEDDWYDALSDLIKNEVLYNGIVENAIEHVKNVYYPSAIGSKTELVYRDIIKSFKIKNIKKDSLKISWVIPEPFEASGGHRNIFRTIKYLSEFGHELKVYVEPASHRFTSSRHVEKFIRDNFMELNAQVVLGTQQISHCDVLFATHWSTAYIVKKNEIKSLSQCYFIQDYEPYFYEMGYEYILASNTYKLGFQHITSGPWCTHLIEKEYNVKGNYFRFPIDRNIYYYDNNLKSDDKIKVVYFARPDMPRRCYPLGVEALNIIKKKYPNCEIIFYGSDKNKYSNIPFEFTNKGMLPSINDLGELYRMADIGVVFSTTNPSLVPYEMMACGCTVVDLNYNNNVVNYESDENVMLVEPNPEAIAKGIERLIIEKDLRNKLIENGLEYCERFPDEEGMVRRIESFIKDGLDKKIY